MLSLSSANKREKFTFPGARSHPFSHPSIFSINKHVYSISFLCRMDTLKCLLLGRLCQANEPNYQTYEYQFKFEKTKNDNDFLVNFCYREAKS